MKFIDYGVLIHVSMGYSPLKGRLYTRYAPVRHSSARASSAVTVRLACVRPAASVHPEPGSNSSSLFFKYIHNTFKYQLEFLITKIYILVKTQNLFYKALIFLFVFRLTCVNRKYTVNSILQ